MHLYTDTLCPLIRKFAVGSPGFTAGEGVCPRKNYASSVTHTDLDDIK
jgi:hypothetical protein